MIQNSDCDSNDSRDQIFFFNIFFYIFFFTTKKFHKKLKNSNCDETQKLNFDKTQKFKL